MVLSNIHKNGFLNECNFSFSKSSGAGGQHVNKVNTKVELRFSIENSELLTVSEKERLKNYLGNKLSIEGDLILTCQETRSQIKNREIVSDRFFFVLSEGLKVRKKRRATKPTKASRLKRLQNKKKHGEKKKLRRRLE